MRSTPTCSSRPSPSRTARKRRTPAPRPSRRTSASPTSSTCRRAVARWPSTLAATSNPSWDFFFVEAHTVGADDWTTLPAYDDTGHEVTSDDPGLFCVWENPFSNLHPFLAHYETFRDDPSDDLDPVCDPHGTTGEWHAATGASEGPERWNVDLRAYAGRSVEVSLTYMSDAYSHGVMAIDDVTVSTGQGTTSFEDDDDPLDGWTVPVHQTAAPETTNDWTTVGQDALPELGGHDRRADVCPGTRDPRVPVGQVRALSVQDGGRDRRRRRVASRSKRRRVRCTPGSTSRSGDRAPTWSSTRWRTSGSGTACAWRAGRTSGSTRGLRSTPSGCGPSTREGPPAGLLRRPHDDHRSRRRLVATRDRRPGTGDLFDGQVYDRGALTLQALRMRVGDAAFFRILKTWTRTKAGRHVTTPQFIALARADLAPGPGRLLRRLALHGRVSGRRDRGRAAGGSVRRTGLHSGRQRGRCTAARSRTPGGTRPS